MQRYTNQIPPRKERSVVSREPPAQLMLPLQRAASPRSCSSWGSLPPALFVLELPAGLAEALWRLHHELTSFSAQSCFLLLRPFIRVGPYFLINIVYPKLHPSTCFQRMQPERWVREQSKQGSYKEMWNDYCGKCSKGKFTGFLFLVLHLEVIPQSLTWVVA